MNKKSRAITGVLKKNEIDALLISSQTNISYLTGFRRAQGYLIVSGKNRTYFTNFIYQYEAEELKKKGITVLIYGYNLFKTIAEFISEHRFHRVGFEGRSLPFLEYKEFKKNLKPGNIELEAVIDGTENLRAVKNSTEIENIKKAAKITEQAFDFAKEIISEDWTEKDLSIELRRFIEIKGDIKAAFDPIVAYEENSYKPHHIPCDTRAGKNRFVLIDLGAKYRGYCADLTKILILDKMPLQIKKIYDIVKTAKSRSIKKIRAGAVIKNVDKAAREYIDKKGYGKYFRHGLGHGVGLNVHEKPFIHPKNEETLKENMVITVEPAIYIPGKFGIRLEDLAVVKKNNCQILNKN